MCCALCYLGGILIHKGHRGPRGRLWEVKLHRNAFLEVTEMQREFPP